MSDDEARYVAGKRTDRFYFSGEVDTPEGRSGRYASVVFPAAPRPHFADVRGETLLRTTASGREQVKAFFMVDNRGIRVLTVQRFGKGGEHAREVAHFSLVGDEVRKLLDLALLIRTAKFDAQEKVRIDADDLHQFNLTGDAVRAWLKSNPRLIDEVIERGVTERDVVAMLAKSLSGSESKA